MGWRKSVCSWASFLWQYRTQGKWKSLASRCTRWRRTASTSCLWPTCTNFGLPQTAFPWALVCTAVASTLALHRKQDHPHHRSTQRGFRQVVPSRASHDTSLSHGDACAVVRIRAGDDGNHTGFGFANRSGTSKVARTGAFERCVRGARCQHVARSTSSSAVATGANILASRHGPKTVWFAVVTNHTNTGWEIP